MFSIIYYVLCIFIPAGHSSTLASGPLAVNSGAGDILTQGKHYDCTAICVSSTSVPI